jgi:hypothetical protein
VRIEYDNAAGLASATISLWVEWNSNSQPAFVSTSNGNAVGMYGSLLGCWPSNSTDSVDWQPFQIGINASTGGAATSDPTQMAGLRLGPGFAEPFVSGFAATSTADSITPPFATYGMPQNGTGFTDPALNRWHNIVVTIAPAPFNTGSMWSMYMDGAFLRSVQSGDGTSGLLYAALQGDPSGAVAAYRANPLTIGALCQGAAGTLVCGSNTTIEDVGIFNSNLDGGVTPNGSGGYTPDNIGLVDAIYNLGVSKLNYNLGAVNQLVTVYGNQSTAGSTINGLTWTYAIGLSGGLGVLQDVSGNYYVQLDGSGGGVEALAAPAHNPGDANGAGRGAARVVNTFGQPNRPQSPNCRL